MKKVLKRIGIGVFVFIGLLIIVAGWYGYQFKSEVKNMKPVPTAKIAGEIFAIQDAFVNLYLVRDGDSLIAIDAGNDISSVAKGMTSLGLDPLKVKAVFLTHTDGDHVAALRLFSNAKVYISVQEEQMLNGKTHRMLMFNNKIDTPYTLIADNQTIVIGKTTVKGIITPGHTPGSMCYLVNDKNLFTGDTLSLHDGEAQKFNKFFNMDSKTEEQSIRKLALLKGVNLVLTAHHGVSSNFEKVFHDWQ